jgi:hypothetical protein
MSAREIIAEIESLPSEEKAAVVQYVTKMTSGTQNGAKAIRYANDADFERVKKEVFTHHAPLLEKLSK